MSANSGSETASILAASHAALAPPSMATEATGMPEGICTVESRASSPPRSDPLIGTPMTGRAVFAAMTPARCAALPAKATITPKPLSAAVFANSAVLSGVLCALMICASYGISSFLSTETAFSAMGRSESLPRMRAVFFIINTPFFIRGIPKLVIPFQYLIIP